MTQPLNIIAEISGIDGLGTLRGSYGANVIFDAQGQPTYYGDFTIVDLPRLEFYRRRPQGLDDRADAILAIDNSNGRFDKLLGDKFLERGKIIIRIGRGDRVSDYAKINTGTSPAMVFKGTILPIGGYARKGDKVFVAATSNPFFGAHPVLTESFDLVSGGSGLAPLIFGDWDTVQMWEDNSGVLAYCMSESGDGGGNWKICQGPIHTIGDVYLSGESLDADERSDRAHFNRYNLTSYQARKSTANGTFSLDEEVDGDFLPFTPGSVRVKVRGIKATAEKPISGVNAGELLTRLRDQLVWAMRYLLNVPEAEIDMGAFRRLSSLQEGRRVIRSQRDARHVIEEIEDDFNLTIVALSGARGRFGRPAGQGQGDGRFVPIFPNHGQKLDDWTPERYLVGDLEVGGSHEYVNDYTYYYSLDAATDNEIFADFGKTESFAADVAQSGFRAHATKVYHWLFKEVFCDTAIGTRLNAQSGGWPRRNVRFKASMDYLDLQPTDRMVLEEQDKVVHFEFEPGEFEEGTRYTHIETIAVDWKNRLFDVTGFKGPSQGQ